MKFHCTLLRGPGPELPEPPLELTIQAPEGTPGGEVHAELALNFNTGTVTVSGEDIRSMRVGEAPLVNGAVLVDGPSQRRAGATRRRPAGDDAQLALAVHTGVAAGTVVPLRRGSYTIGRSGTRVVIPDPELSREHARLVVTETQIMIEDLDSVNGIHIDGRKVRNAVLTTGSSIRCGNTAMSLVFMEQPENALADAGTATSEPLRVPGRTDIGNRAVLFLTAVLPLLIGIGLAVLTGMWMFLAFAAASGVSVLVPLAAGRRQHRRLTKAVAAAVEEDRERRRRSGPSLALLVLAAGHRHSNADPADDGGGVWLRLGEAPQSANVKVEPTSSPVPIPPAGPVPVTLSPEIPRTTFRGPQGVAEGLLRSLVMQLAGYPAGRSTRIVIHGEASRLPLGARYLTNVTLAPSANDVVQILDKGFGPAHQRGVLLILGTSEDDAVISGSAAALSWQVLQFLPDSPGANPCDINLSERSSTLPLATGDVRFVPDLAPEEVFTEFCRRLAGVLETPDSGGLAVPPVCSLQDVLAFSRTETSTRWNASARNSGLQVPLGLGSAGARVLDLETDGPHLLVAGTTGSGKSELLRTLTLSLALSHPPSRVNFLFVDFKGGSGLGPLTDLVHCVGLVTDLSTYELERTLTSLRAEIRLREETLASARTPDLTAYNNANTAPDLPLPHLVIVIDEFRMLVDDAPEVLRELMRIAAIGRSLGIHLVMATQRPQGALTADIRANVTTSIALRVQSEMESLDIINSKDAAAISVDAPGRAFLMRGSEAPQEFQTAAISAASTRARQLEAVTVQLAAKCLESTRPTCGVAAGQTPAQAAAPLVAMVRELWSEQQGSMPRSPVAPPLPVNLPAPGTGTANLSANGDRNPEQSIHLGLVDLPDKQRVAPLGWHPADHSHLALVGCASSGALEALELAVTQVVLSPLERHGYILDAGGFLQKVAGHERIGAFVGLHELRRAVRVLERLKQELSRRLGQGGGQGGIPLVVAISGWGSWVSAFRAGPLAWAEDLVQDLVRDGSRAGITSLIQGDRELVSSRAFSALPNRLFFPTGSNADSRVAWPRMPATADLKGRAVAFGPISGGGPAVCQLYSPHPYETWVPDLRDCRNSTLTRRPFRVEQLPAVVPATKISPVAVAGSTAGHLACSGTEPVLAGTRAGSFLIGVGGDELGPASCRLQAGAVFTVLGGAGSGKTNFLAALPLMNPGGGPWLHARDGFDASDFWEQSLTRATAGEIPARTVALVDDADLLPAKAIQNLSALNGLGYPVVLTASYSPLLLQRVPLVMGSRSAGTGLLLAPRALSDGDLFGVRFEVEANAPPGRGVLIHHGTARSIQVGWAPPVPEQP